MDEGKLMDIADQLVKLYRKRGKGLKLDQAVAILRQVAEMAEHGVDEEIKKIASQLFFSQPQTTGELIEIAEIKASMATAICYEAEKIGVPTSGKMLKVALAFGDQDITVAGCMRLAVYDYCQTEIDDRDLFVTVYDYQVEDFAEGVKRFLELSDDEDVFVGMFPYGVVGENEDCYRYGKHSLDAVVSSITQVLSFAFTQTPEDIERDRQDRLRPPAALWLRVPGIEATGDEVTELTVALQVTTQVEDSGIPIEVPLTAALSPFGAELCAGMTDSRVLVTIPKERLREFCQKIEEFARKHCMIRVYPYGNGEIVGACFGVDQQTGSRFPDWTFNNLAHMFLSKEDNAETLAQMISMRDNPLVPKLPDADKTE